MANGDPDPPSSGLPTSSTVPPSRAMTLRQKIYEPFRLLLFPQKEEQDRTLLLVEYYVVCFISFLIILVFVYLIARIFRGFWQTPGPYERLQTVLADLHNNWHLGAIILIPLFYRPLRKFMEEVKKIWGLERAPQPPNKPSDQEPVNRGSGT